eukprot:scaffold2785_cov302-Prasinococcus_capsulatus_cf.AAC.2
MPPEDSCPLTAHFARAKSWVILAGGRGSSPLTTYMRVSCRLPPQPMGRGVMAVAHVMSVYCLIRPVNCTRMPLASLNAVCWLSHSTVDGRSMCR